MAKVFQELAKQADNIAQLIEGKESEGVQQACAAIKVLLLESVGDIKKSLAGVVKNNDRRQAKSMRTEVKNSRVVVESSIRSDYLKSDPGKAEAREDLIVVAKKMIQIEKALGFADDMLFAGEIVTDMGDVVQQAEAAVAESKTAVEAMKHVKQAEARSDRSLDSSNRMGH
jgi:hypothetical protein